MKEDDPPIQVAQEIIDQSRDLEGARVAVRRPLRRLLVPRWCWWQLGTGCGGEGSHQRGVFWRGRTGQITCSVKESGQRRWALGWVLKPGENQGGEGEPRWAWRSRRCHLREAWQVRLAGGGAREMPARSALGLTCDASHTRPFPCSGHHVRQSEHKQVKLILIYLHLTQSIQDILILTLD